MPRQITLTLPNGNREHRWLDGAPEIGSIVVVEGKEWVVVSVEDQYLCTLEARHDLSMPGGEVAPAT